MDVELMHNPSLNSFVHVAKSLGMEIVLAEFSKRYGGDIRVFLSGKSGAVSTRDKLVEVDALESGFGASLEPLVKPPLSVGAPSHD